jgi:hypothetical protein
MFSLVTWRKQQLRVIVWKSLPDFKQRRPCTFARPSLKHL